ncbi:MAG: alpha/beta hydrolase [Caldilineaceae bacterium]|nr:alpha/beta hydrolase [Caldilineaceae bacterium]
MPFFETESGIIHYEILGDDPSIPVLTLLHNFMSSGRSAWGPMINDLSAHYRILLPDSPGHGRSQGYPDSFDHRQMARQLADLMRAEDAHTGHLAGVSSGGMIAQQMVHLGWVEPATLTLISTTYSNDASITGADRALKPENFKAGQRWLEATARLHDPYHYPGYFDEVLLGNFRQLTAEQTINLTLDDLSKWEMPVCLIHGSEDEFFAPALVEEMASAIPTAELHLIPQQPHALIFKRPWLVSEIMQDFLKRHSSM